MSFCHHRGCELYSEFYVSGIAHVCAGRIEFAHLSDRKRYDVGDIGAGLCKRAHESIDGQVGGKAPWYVALGKPGQKLLRDRLSGRARAAWDALPPDARDAWDEVGRNLFASRRAA